MDRSNVDTADACDYGGHTAFSVRLNIGGGAGVYLCRTDWDSEMKWRLERNKSLHPDNQFDILPWPIWERETDAP